MRALLSDVRLAIRTLRRSPSYTIAGLITLILGIGAITAVFSVVHGILLSPLPFAEPDRLVRVWERNRTGEDIPRVAWKNFSDWRASASSFDALVAHSPAKQTTILLDGEPVHVGVSGVSERFLQMFGTFPVLGRDFLPEEHQLGGDPAVVASHAFWRSQLGGAPDISGFRVTIGDHVARIVGVLPPEFRYPPGGDVLYPLEWSRQSDSRTSHNLEVVGRLSGGTTGSAARAELDAITRRFREEDPSIVGEEWFERFFPYTVGVEPLHDALIGDVRRPLWVLMWGAALVLLVCCTNLTITTLARAIGREQECSIRRALGGSRAAVVRQLFVESLLLAFIGAALGVLFAASAVRALVALAPADLPRIENVDVHGAVLAAAVIATLLSSVLFGLLPALRAAGGRMGGMLRVGAASAMQGRDRIWRLLIGFEIALAFVLLSSATLLIRSFANVISVDPGYRTESLLTATVHPLTGRYPDDDSKRRYYDALLRQLAAVPGVMDVGLISTPPMASGPNGHVHVDGRSETGATGDYQLVGGDYFQIMGIPLLRGRAFDSSDRAGAPDVVIVSESFAKVAWPGEDPIGKRMTGGGLDSYGGRQRWASVVGVAGDVHQHDLTAEPTPTFYFPYHQRPFMARNMTAILSAEGDNVETLGSAVRAAVREVDPSVAAMLSTMEARMAGALSSRASITMILGGFSGVALLLACVGVWGVVTYAVARRRREIGVRMALGADTRSVRHLLQRDSLWAAGTGAALGLGLSLWLSRLLDRLLFEIAPVDLTSLVAVGAILGAAVWLSSFVPSLRASRLPPMDAMRSE